MQICLRDKLGQTGGGSRDKRPPQCAKTKESRRKGRMRDAEMDIVQFVKMRPWVLFLMLAIASQTNGAGPTESGSSPLVQSGIMHAFVANRTDGQPTKKFFTDTTKIYGIWQGEALKAGDMIEAIWIAESFGYSRKDVRITRGETIAYKPDDVGIFSLARPVAGWPVGRYRLELYAGRKLAAVVKFAIEADVTVEVK